MFDLISQHLKALEALKLDAETELFIKNELALAALQMAPAEPEVKDLKKLHEDMTASFGNLKTLLDQQADEIRTHGETHGKTADGIKSLETRIATFDTEIKGINTKFTEMETKMNRPEFMGAGAGEESKSVGQQFAESEAYKRMITNGAKSSDSIQVKSFHTKATLTSGAGSAGNLVTPQRYGQLIVPQPRDLRIRDLMNVQGTTSNAIEYIRETLFTNAAAPVAETLLKPESALTFDVASATVKTIAHWIPATRQIIADAPMLQNYVDNRLVYGLKLTEEGQILYGNGTGENLLGLMVDGGVQNIGVRGAATLIDHIRHAITVASLAGYPVTGIVLHPSDWETIELSKGGDDHYIWVNVQTGGTSQLWAVPVVQSLGINTGDFLVGAFGLGSQIWDREDANVRISEHHADYFTRNMIAILAEERLAMTTYRPQAFVKGSFATA